MRRWVMRTLSAVCGCLGLVIDYFEGRGWYRTADFIAKGYWGVDLIQWRLTQRNIRRLHDKQRAERAD